jgi:thiaminase/transcriptional activator TenA
VAGTAGILSFYDSLRGRAAGIWAAAAQHPFVAGIGDGSLPVERFKFYIRQDYVFLIEFSRVLALAVARAADDLDAMAHYAQLLESTLNGEMELHRGYCARFGISREALATTSAAPVTHAYTRHLLRVGHCGTLAEITAALVPCMCGYAEIGGELAGRGEPASQPLYGEWIRTYAAPEVQDLAAWLQGLLDRLAVEAGDAERERAASAFMTSARYELLFWDAAYEMKDWPL